MPMDKLVRTRIRWWMIVVACTALGPSVLAQTDSTPLPIVPVPPPEDSVDATMPASHRAVLQGPKSRVRRLYCPPAMYPTALWQYGFSGRVAFRFVVDTLGRPELQDMVVEEATHQGFVPAARRTIAKCRYDAVTAEGRRVRALVRQGINFRRDSTTLN
jgi:hypothetical protein